MLLVVFITWHSYPGTPAVITVMAFPDCMMQDGVPVTETCRVLEERGAAVVGVNCARGPDSVLPVMKEVRKVTKVSFRS